MQLIPLQAGLLSMLFDKESAFVRYVRFQNIEIVRGIFPAVRDQDWNTIPFTIEDFDINQTESEFDIFYIARCQHDSIDFSWQGRLTGTSDGVIEYRFCGTAHSSFLKNRIGLCALHPIDGLSGKECIIQHVDQSFTHGRFPKFISPHQPFKNVASISHKIGPDFTICTSFSGDVFEMEDQRNWTDASFKTYGTSLEVPFPVLIQAGAKIEQQIRISLIDTSRFESGSSSQVCGASRHSDSTFTREYQRPNEVQPKLLIDSASTRLRPSIGFGLSPTTLKCHDGVISRLNDLRPDHLRVDLWLSSDTWRSRLEAAVDIAIQVDAGLEVGIFAADATGQAWRGCLEALAPSKSMIDRILIFHEIEKTTPNELTKAALASLSKSGFASRIVVGTNAYFAELNRQRPEVPKECGIVYSINPQVHAFDNLSLCETLEAQRSTVDSAENLFGSNVVISPITLKPRFNPNATSTNTMLGNSLVLVSDDRQSMGFAAAWTVGSLRALATHPAVESLTYFEVFCSRGIMDDFGNPFPSYEVFASILDAKSVMCVSSSSPIEVTAISTINSEGRQKLLIANMTGHNKTVIIECPNGLRTSLNLPREKVTYFDWSDIK